MHESSCRSKFIDEVEEILLPILSPRQPFSKITTSFSELSEQQKLHALSWVKIFAVSNIELAYVFACKIGKANQNLGRKGVLVWLNQALTIYDKEGLYPAIQAIQDITAFKQRYLKQSYTCTLEEVKPKLEVFIRALLGRNLDIKISNKIFTDTITLYLPETISKYDDKTKNQALYKSMACFLWAQTWYGTFRRQSLFSESTQDKIDSYENPGRACQIFLALENIRLMANIQRDLPGLYREMNRLSPLVLSKDKTYLSVSKRLQQPNSTVEDTFVALDVLLKLDVILPLTSYQGDINLTQVSVVQNDSNHKIMSKINNMIHKNEISETFLSKLLEELLQGHQGEGDSISSSDSLSGSIDDETLRDNVKSLLASLKQDVNHLSIEDFTGEESDQYGLELISADLLDLETDSTVCLDEWDYFRQNYRKKWCQLQIRETKELKDNFKQQTEHKYPFLSRQIHRVFEAMRDQPKRSNKQRDGDQIDLDAVVDMHTARHAGEELSDRMYSRREYIDRSVSVCLLVDMSGSTKGWINLAIRESLILFCEALNILGDQYSIFGFSGLTRQRCEIYVVKQFEDYNKTIINNRISNIQAKDYTRMGFAIRYATKQLILNESKHRILFILSDGKPDDYDGYQGEYGIQDTRKAILEAQGQGISPYSITIDKQAQKYLPRLFGPNQYSILDDVSSLPIKLTQVYRKLST